MLTERKVNITLQVEMYKSFAKYFLTLCIVLLSGAGTVFANVAFKGTLGFSASHSNFSQIDSVDGDSKNESAHLFCGSTSDKGKTNDVDLIEFQEEEEESVSSRKYQIKKHHFTSLLSELAKGYLLHHYVKVALQEQSFSNASYPERFITLRVLRL